MQALFYVTFLAVATFLWGYAFYKKDYHPQPKSVLFKTFAIGLFSMAPLFAYKFAYQKLLPNLAEYSIFRPLLDSGLFAGMTYFLLNVGLLSLVLFALGAALSFILTLFDIPTLKNIKRALREEPLGFVVVSVMIGILIYAEALIGKILGISIMQTILGTVLFLTIIEEYIKHLMVRFVDDNKLRDIDDAITLSVMIGLAFAFIESLIYSLAAGDFSLIIYRSLISMPIHLIASGIFGYYYGLAHFAKPIVQNTGGDRGSKWLHKALHLKKDIAYSEEKIAEGLLLATAFHAVSNIFLETGLAYMTVPMIVLGLYAVSGLYNLGVSELWMIKTKKAAQKQLRTKKA